MPRLGEVCAERSPPAAGAGAATGVMPLAWQFRQRMVLTGVKVHSLYGDVPARLSAIFALWLVPFASTGWKERLSGLNSAPASRASVEGLPGTCGSRFVKLEWHLRQSWYSRVTGLMAPSRNL